MPKKYLYFKLKEDYAGHKKDEVIRIAGKIPPHLKDYGSEVKESTYTEFVKRAKEGKIAGTEQTIANEESGVKAYEAPETPEAPSNFTQDESGADRPAKVMGVDTNNPTREGETESERPGVRSSIKPTLKGGKRK